MSGNDHGWKPLGRTEDGGSVSFGRVVDRHTCACKSCARIATQEDLRCDECRAGCRDRDGEL